jgi:pimeloyl-ACP methyl ester carboxylesterase
VDPLEEKYPELTPYQFASNTPIQATDLDGKEAFYVHGTWSNPSTFSKISITTIDNITHNKTYKMFKWSGNNTSQARIKAGSDLANFIIKNRDPKQPLNIIGHSHGGNVAIMAANELKKDGIQVDNIITINTPSREYQLDQGAARNHIQIYQDLDPVQGNAGNTFNIPDKVTVNSYPQLAQVCREGQAGKCLLVPHLPQRSFTPPIARLLMLPSASAGVA